MEAVIRRTAFVYCVAIVFASRAVAADSGNRVGLNEIASSFATELINHGNVVADNKGNWTEHRPSTVEENKFIRTYGFAEYAKWHLGIDHRFSENSKRRYKFPYGDFKNVHRCGLLAAKARAREYGYTDIKDAAAKLVQATKTKPKN